MINHDYLIIFREMESVIMPGYYLRRLRHHGTRPEGTAHPAHAVTGTAKPGQSCLLQSRASSVGIMRNAGKRQSSGAEARSMDAESHLLLVVGTLGCFLHLGSKRYALLLRIRRRSNPISTECVPNTGVLYCGPSYVYNFLKPV